jgi:AraC-like DNA-binding protein
LFIDNNYFDNIDLDNISDEAYFSKFHFIRLFKNIYGKTPHQYLMQVRMENAKEFLGQGFSVTDTIYKVGFDSITYFTGLFKRINGLPPSAYQRQFFIRKEKIKMNPLDFIPNCFAEQRGWLINSNFQEV